MFTMLAVFTATFYVILFISTDEAGGFQPFVEAAKHHYHEQTFFMADSTNIQSAEFTIISCLQYQHQILA